MVKKGLEEYDFYLTAIDMLEKRLEELYDLIGDLDKNLEGLSEQTIKEIGKITSSTIKQVEELINKYRESLKNQVKII